MSAPPGSRFLPAEGGRLWIKICGLTHPEAVCAAVESGADAVGFVLSESLRRVSPSQAAVLISATPRGTTTVAVFRNAERGILRQAVEELDPDLVQVEPTPGVQDVVPEGRLLPVYHDGTDLLDELAAAGARNAARPAILLEAAGRGGRGLRPDWQRAAVAARAVRLVLAGGLTPANVAEAIRTVRPAGVDVSSGVESRPAHKDPHRIVAFVEAARAVEEEAAA